MSPNFPPYGAPYLLAANPQVRRPIEPRPLPPPLNPPKAGDRLVLARIIAAAHVRSAQEIMRVSAWFLAFGAIRIVLDIRAARLSRRRGSSAVERDGRMGGRRN
jgi:hypothetical protein